MQLVWGFRGEAKDFARIGAKTCVYDSAEPKQA